MVATWLGWTSTTNPLRSWSRSAAGAATSSADDRRRQERRRNELQLLGTDVYFFTTEDIVGDPGYVVATVRSARWRSRHEREACTPSSGFRSSDVHACGCNDRSGRWAAASGRCRRTAGGRGRQAGGERPGPAGQRATKYLARGWWQMMAEVVCSGWYCQPVSSLTSMPRRSAPSSRATVALSSRSGQAG